MTRITFYFNVLNKHYLLESLVATAFQKRRRVSIVVANDLAATNASDYLWQKNATHFLPNVLAHAERAVLTPVHIFTQGSDKTPDANQDDLLVNLTQSEPSFFSRYTQLVEIVSMEELDKIAGRQRYIFYRDRGYEINNIDYMHSNANA